MALNTNIDDWSTEHDRAVRTLIRMSTVKYKELHQDLFPSDVMVIGENWFYIADLGYVGGRNTPIGGGLSLDWSSAFTLNYKQAIQTRRYTPLGKILDAFREDLPADEMALFPLTQQRQDEVRGLGSAHEERDDWYTIQRENGKRIKVFPMTPEFETVYLGKLPDGSAVGYTPMNRKPPINLG